ncbi:hypothetical protein BC833DRAFT_605849 [Globomyces pollinis-pini]|nr:hypothetical protein BC833DRAFT_605849 [Globomyces pollinis-pini]
MVSKEEEIPKYDIAIEWVVIIFYIGLAVINLCLVVYLIQGRLKNKRISKYLIPMAFFGLIWVASQTIENNFFHNQFWSVFQRFWAYLLTLFSAELNAELLKTFSVLSTFWNVKRVLYLQILLLVLHILLCGGSYIKLAVNLGNFATILYMAESLWLLLAAISNYMCSFSVVFLVYRDSKRMKAKNNNDVNKSHYWKLLTTLIVNGVIDFLGVLMYIYVIVQPFPDSAIGIRMSYAYQRLATTPLGMHCLMITNVFIHLRFMKFSKEMSVKGKNNQNHHKTINGNKTIT